MVLEEILNRYFPDLVLLKRHQERLFMSSKRLDFEEDDSITHEKYVGFTRAKNHRKIDKLEDQSSLSLLEKIVDFQTAKVAYVSDSFIKR